MEEIPFLEGKNLYLRALVELDSEGPYTQWFNDAEVCKGNSHHIFPYTVNDARLYIGDANREKTRMVLGIFCRNNKLHIGNISLDQINYISRNAILSIIVGEKTCWEKGYGKEAARLICDHGFLSLNLHRISCGTFENNIGMCELAKFLGMVQEGRRRQAVYKDGRYLDIIEFGVLRDEYLIRFSSDT
jgi:RimJ/RimL family protein N-acetyltransferase